MKRVCLVILLLFSSFASLQAERIAELRPVDPEKTYEIYRRPDGTIVGKPAEPVSLTKLILAGIGVALLAIFSNSN